MDTTTTSSPPHEDSAAASVASGVADASFTFSATADLGATAVSVGHGRETDIHLVAEFFVRYPPLIKIPVAFRKEEKTGKWKRRILMVDTMPNGLYELNVYRRRKPAKGVARPNKLMQTLPLNALHEVKRGRLLPSQALAFEDEELGAKEYRFGHITLTLVFDPAALAAYRQHESPRRTRFMSVLRGGDQGGAGPPGYEDEEEEKEDDNLEATKLELCCKSVEERDKWHDWFTNLIVASEMDELNRSEGEAEDMSGQDSAPPAHISLHNFVQGFLNHASAHSTKGGDSGKTVKKSLSLANPPAKGQAYMLDKDLLEAQQNSDTPPKKDKKRKKKKKKGDEDGGDGFVLRSISAHSSHKGNIFVKPVKGGNAADTKQFDLSEYLVQFTTPWSRNFFLTQILGRDEGGTVSDAASSGTMRVLGSTVSLNSLAAKKPAYRLGERIEFRANTPDERAEFVEWLVFVRGVPQTDEETLLLRDNDRGSTTDRTTDWDTTSVASARLRNASALGDASATNISFAGDVPYVEEVEEVESPPRSESPSVTSPEQPAVVVHVPPWGLWPSIVGDEAFTAAQQMMPSVGSTGSGGGGASGRSHSMTFIGSQNVPVLNHARSFSSPVRPKSVRRPGQSMMVRGSGGVAHVPFPAPFSPSPKSSRSGSTQASPASIAPPDIVLSAEPQQVKGAKGNAPPQEDVFLVTSETSITLHESTPPQSPDDKPPPSYTEDAEPEGAVESTQQQEQDRSVPLDVVRAAVQEAVDNALMSASQRIDGNREPSPEPQQPAATPTAAMPPPTTPEAAEVEAARVAAEQKEAEELTAQMTRDDVKRIEGIQKTMKSKFGWGKTKQPQQQAVPTVAPLTAPSDGAGEKPKSSASADPATNEVDESCSPVRRADTPPLTQAEGTKDVVPVEEPVAVARTPTRSRSVTIDPNPRHEATPPPDMGGAHSESVNTEHKQTPQQTPPPQETSPTHSTEPSDTAEARVATPPSVSTPTATPPVSSTSSPTATPLTAEVEALREEVLRLRQETHSYQSQAAVAARENEELKERLVATTQQRAPSHDAPEAEAEAEAEEAPQPQPPNGVQEHMDQPSAVPTTPPAATPERCSPPQPIQSSADTPAPVDEAAAPGATAIEEDDEKDTAAAVAAAESIAAAAIENAVVSEVRGVEDTESDLMAFHDDPRVGQITKTVVEDGGVLSQQCCAEVRHRSELIVPFCSATCVVTGERVTAAGSARNSILFNFVAPSRNAKARHFLVPFDGVRCVYAGKSSLLTPNCVVTIAMKTGTVVTVVFPTTTVMKVWVNALRVIAGGALCIDAKNGDAPADATGRCALCSQVAERTLICSATKAVHRAYNWRKDPALKQGYKRVAPKSPDVVRAESNAVLERAKELLARVR